LTRQWNAHLPAAASVWQTTHNHRSTPDISGARLPDTGYYFSKLILCTYYCLYCMLFNMYSYLHGLILPSVCDVVSLFIFRNEAPYKYHGGIYHQSEYPIVVLCNDHDATCHWLR
jgi:hypothetical protein